jgi:ABC-type transport system involved in multi-copper enzyme maturation permease subunit
LNPPHDKPVPRWRGTLETLVGPLFSFELLRLGRKNWQYLLRCGYALVLVSVLFGVYLDWYGWPPPSQWFTARLSVPHNELARLSETLLTAIVVTQVAAVIVLTPIFVAGFIIDERNRGTLDLLLTTHLSSREILLGKLAARLLAVAWLLLAALPVLAIMQIWGGVDAYVTFAGFASLFMYLITVGAVSISVSAKGMSYAGAVFESYGILFLSMVFCPVIPHVSYLMNPIYFLIELTEQMGGGARWNFRLYPPNFLFGGSQLGIVCQMVLEFALFQGVIALLFIWHAAAILRKERGPDLIAIKEGSILTERSGGKPGNRRVFSLPQQAEGKAVLRWKEVESKFALLDSPVNQGEAVMVLGVLLVFVIQTIVYLRMGKSESLLDNELNQVMRFIFMVALTGMGGMIALLSAGCISREREQRTLESLLTLPVEWGDILWAKWLGNIIRFQAMGIIFAVFLGVETLLGAFSPLATVLIVLATAVYLLFFSSLGLYMSLSCRSTLQASMYTGSVLAAVTIVPLFLLLTEADWLQSAINPVATWYTLAFHHQEFATANWVFWRSLAAALVGVIGYALASWWLWRRSGRLFQEEKTRFQQ